MARWMDGWMDGAIHVMLASLTARYARSKPHPDIKPLAQVPAFQLPVGGHATCQVSRCIHLTHW